MHPNLTNLQRVDELDRLLEQSEAQPVLLFKHSFTCGVSAEALDELIAHLSEELADVRYAMVTVQTHREVSNAVAAQPQRSWLKVVQGRHKVNHGKEAV